MNKKTVKGFPLILGYFGLFLVLEGVVTIFPLAILLFYPGEWMCYLDFLVPGLSAMALGFLLVLLFLVGRKKGRLAKHEDSVLLVLIWLSAFAIGALPFYLTGVPSLNGGDSNMSLGMSYTESFFEATSGYTTNGMSLVPSSMYLVGVDSVDYPCSHIFLFHRAFMQFTGGVGLVLLVTSLISSDNSFKLFFAEGHNDRLLPNASRNAKLIFGIYSAWVAFGTLALWLAGMAPFDAFCFSVASLATGGFSSREGSLTYFASESYEGNMLYKGNIYAMEAVTCLLMLAGAMNFVLHTFLLKGKWKDFFKDIEIKVVIFILIVCTLLGALATYLDASVYKESYLTAYYGSEGISFWQSLRYSFFSMVTSISTTGHVNYSDVRMLGHFAVFLSILVMSVGGGMGSTAGGLKQFRVGILAKELRFKIKNDATSDRLLKPNTYYRLGQEERVEEDVLHEAIDYSSLYLVFLFVGSLSLLLLQDLDIEESIYMWSTSITSQGVSIISFTGYKAAHSLVQYDSLVWILSFAMFIGRLEIYPLINAIRHVSVEFVQSIGDKMRKRVRIKE